MKSRQISIVSIILAILAGIWILCMILLMQQQGSAIAGYEEAVDFVKDPGGLFYLTYMNVVVLTVSDVVLFGIPSVLFGMAIYRMDGRLSRGTG